MTTKPKQTIDQQIKKLDKEITQLQKENQKLQKELNSPLLDKPKKQNSPKKFVATLPTVKK